MLNNIKKIFLTIISQGIILGLSVVSGFILPEKMGPENFGYWQIYLFYITYLNLFGLGFNDGIALYYGGYYYDKLPFEKLRASMRIIYTYLLFVCIIGVGLVSLMCSEGIYRFIGLSLVLNIPFTCVQCIVLTVFLSVGKTEIYNFINLLLKVMTVAFYLILIFNNHTNAVGMVCVDTLGRIIITLICVVLGRKFLFGKRSKIRDGWNEIVEKSKSGFLITIALISSMLMPMLGRWIVERYESITVYGIYSFAMSLLSIILSFTSVLGTVMFPILKRMKSDRMEERYCDFALICDCIITVALFMYIPLLFIVKTFMMQYMPTLEYLYILLAMCIPLGRMQLLVIPYYKAKRMEKEYLIVNIIGVIGMFSSLLMTYKFLGNVYSVAFATTVVMYGWTLLSELFLYRNRNKRKLIKQALWEIFIMFIFGFAGSFQSYAMFITIYGLGVILYFIVIRKELLYSLQSLK